MDPDELVEHVTSVNMAALMDATSTYRQGGDRRGRALSPRRLVPAFTNSHDNLDRQWLQSATLPDPDRSGDTIVNQGSEHLHRISASASPWLGPTAELTPTRHSQTHHQHQSVSATTATTTATIDSDSGVQAFLPTIEGYTFSTKYSPLAYVGKQDDTNAEVYLKARPLGPTNDGVPYTIIRELSILRSLNHPNIITLHRTCRIEHDIMCIFEFLPFSLRSELSNADPTHPQLNARASMKDILAGLGYLHQQGIMHRDLKPHKIRMVTPGAPLKICNFSISRHFHIEQRTYTHQVVTLWYRPPEILLGSKRYGTAIDMWSAGCIFAEFYSKTPLFQGDSEIDQLFRIFQLMGTPTNKTWPGVKKLSDYRATFPLWHPRDITSVVPNLIPTGVDLLKKLLRCNPGERISAAEALQHEFIPDNVDDGCDKDAVMDHVQSDADRPETVQNDSTMSILQTIQMQMTDGP